MSDENKFIEQKGLRRRLNNGQLPVIVDVRTPEEFGASHTMGAIRAVSVRLESGGIPKELSMRESDSIDSLWGNNAEALFDGLARTSD
jgi:rhodanese-related sulfurtransferase